MFTTLEDLTISQPELIAALTRSGPDTYTDVWDPLRIATQHVTCFPQTRSRLATASTSASNARWQGTPCG